MKALLEAIGKVPVDCTAAPGFIVPRLQALVMNEAARMVEQGVASAEDIDRAVRYGFGFRYANMGLVEFIDYGGLDILYYASRYLAQSLATRATPRPRSSTATCTKAATACATGAGFYDWKAIDVAAYRREVLGRQLAALRQLGLLKPPGPARSS